MHLDKETAPLPVLVRVARTGEALRRVHDRDARSPGGER